MTNICWGTRRPDGFSAIELMMTMGVMSVVGSMAAFQIGLSQPSLKGDGAMRVVIAQLNTARELAITQRRNIQVNFNGTDVVQLVRQDVPAGTTTIATIPFEGAATYGLITGIPDTPDAFGNHVPIDFGAATSIRFSSDCTVIDQLGNPINGTVFLQVGNSWTSARAVTILGATGRIRGYRWEGKHWVLV